MSVYLDQIRMIAWKDLLLELRTRERLAAMAAFAVLAAVLFNFSLDTTIVRPQDVAAGLIWMTLVFGGLLGVGRTFHLESQDGALQGVLTSPTPKDAVFLGKTAANFTLLFVVSLLVLEAGLLSAFGALLGVVFVYAGLMGLQPWLEGQFGLQVPIRALDRVQMLYVGAVVVLGFVAGLVPAVKAYRTALHDGLSVRV